jgi:glutamate dehydrogenase (NAD(P)+)
MEYQGATQNAALAALAAKIRENTGAALQAARATQVAPRQAALDLASTQVTQAMRYRRFSIL